MQTIKESLGEIYDSLTNIIMALWLFFASFVAQIEVNGIALVNSLIDRTRDSKVYKKVEDLQGSGQHVIQNGLAKVGEKFKEAERFLKVKLSETEPVRAEAAEQTMNSS